jgi:hypothetical protein
MPLVKNFAILYIEVDVCMNVRDERDREMGMAVRLNWPNPKVFVLSLRDTQQISMVTG